MDVPTYPKPLFITDAAVNIAPTLDDSRYRNSLLFCQRYQWPPVGQFARATARAT
jgi:hypothetical protein